jgi:uncharacterized protein DUF6220
VTQARVFFFGLAVIYLAGVVVQFFLAGLGTFGATDFDPHRVFGLILALLTLVLLVLAVVGRLPRLLIGLAVALVGLNVLQMFLARINVDEIAALHVVNALAIVFAAYEIAQRSRRYLASQMAAP